MLFRSEGGWWCVPAEAAAVAPVVGLDLTRRHAPAPHARPSDLPGAVRIGPLDADAVRRVVVTLAAAEAAGVARWCLETAVDYAKVREQFGRRIGSFQAVKHLCAQMLETAEAVTAAAWDAASAAANHVEQADTAEQWDFAVDVAAVTCFEGAISAVTTCIQVLGGIGFTYEHDAHLYLRRAHALAALAGAPDEIGRAHV